MRLLTELQKKREKRAKVCNLHACSTKVPWRYLQNAAVFFFSFSLMPLCCFPLRAFKQPICWQRWPTSIHSVLYSSIHPLIYSPIDKHLFWASLTSKFSVPWIWWHFKLMPCWWINCPRLSYTTFCLQLFCHKTFCNIIIIMLLFGCLAGLIFRMICAICIIATLTLT